MTLESRIQPETRCRHMNEVRPTGACDVCCPAMFPPRAEVERQIRALELRRAMRDLRVLVDDLEEVANRCSPDMNANGVQSLQQKHGGSRMLALQNPRTKRSRKRKEALMLAAPAATETQELDFRPHHKNCRVCRKPIYVGDIAYKTTMHAPQISGRVHYWMCVRCQSSLDAALGLAEKKVGAAC